MQFYKQQTVFFIWLYQDDNKFVAVICRYLNYNLQYKKYL